MTLKTTDVLMVKELLNNIKTECGKCGETLTNESVAGYFIFKDGIIRICHKCFYITEDTNDNN